MNLNIRAAGMDLTPAIRQYVEEKMGALEKYCDSIVHAEVDIGRETRHHQKGDVFFCSAVIHVPGEVFKVQKDEEDLYKAIDKVKDHFHEVLTAWKEKIIDRHRQPRP